MAAESGGSGERGCDTTHANPCGSTDLHACNHPNCSCFWCRVSRREPMATGHDTQSIGGAEIHDADDLLSGING